jgi:hypothetical protein
MEGMIYTEKILSLENELRIYNKNYRYTILQTKQLLRWVQGTKVTNHCMEIKLATVCKDGNLKEISPPLFVFYC